MERNKLINLLTGTVMFAAGAGLAWYAIPKEPAVLPELAADSLIPQDSVALREICGGEPGAVGKNPDNLYRVYRVSEGPIYRSYRTRGSVRFIQQIADNSRICPR